MVERLPAIKVRIKDIVDGRFFYGDKDQMKPSYLITKYGEKISRVNLIGTIIDKFVSDDGNYIFFVLDDGTDSIRIKLFKDLAEKYNYFDVGDLVMVIGKIREYMGEVYINGEIIKRIKDTNYETYRKLEIIKTIKRYKKIIKDLKEKRDKMNDEEFIEYAKSKGFDKESLEVVMQFNDFEEKDYKNRLLYLISELDSGGGVEIEKILDAVKLPEEIIESAISELIDDGSIYEPTPGKFKVVKNEL